MPEDLMKLHKFSMPVADPMPKPEPVPEVSKISIPVPAQQRSPIFSIYPNKYKII